jgi:hypothetical protein
VCHALPSNRLDSFDSVLCRSCQVIRTHQSFPQPIAAYFSSQEQLRGFNGSSTADCELASIPSASIDTLHDRRATRWTATSMWTTQRSQRAPRQLSTCWVSPEIGRSLCLHAVMLFSMSVRTAGPCSEATHVIAGGFFTIATLLLLRNLLRAVGASFLRALPKSKPAAKPTAAHLLRRPAQKAEVQSQPGCVFWCYCQGTAGRNCL